MEQSAGVSIEDFDYRSYFISIVDKLHDTNYFPSNDEFCALAWCLTSLLEADTWYEIVNDIKIIDPDEEEQQRTEEEIRRAQAKRAAENKEHPQITEITPPRPSDQLPKIRDLLQEISKQYTENILKSNKEKIDKTLFEINLTVILIDQLLESTFDIDYCVKYLSETNKLNVLATKVIALTYKRAKQWELALGMFHRLLLLTSSPSVHCNIGDVYSSLNNLKSALKHYSLALVLQPRNEKAMKRTEVTKRKYVTEKVLKMQHVQCIIEKNQRAITMPSPSSTQTHSTQPDSIWDMPSPSRALVEFFDRWKSGEQTTLPSKTRRRDRHSKASSNTFSAVPVTSGNNNATTNNNNNNFESKEEISVLAKAFQTVNSSRFIDDGIPTRTVKSQTPFFEYISTTTPEDDSNCCTGFCCGQRVSLYPWLAGQATQEGGPVTDSFGIACHRNLIISAIADGSSFGSHSARQAATKAVEGFIKEFTQSHQIIDTLSQIPNLLLQALAGAHNYILRSEEGGQQLGTSTLLGGVLIPQSELGKWTYVCASVGDCKAFHYSFASKKVIEITAGNDSLQESRDDPGGAIGAVDMFQIQPDLRNLRIFSHPCHDRDLIFLVTDGVHDNFNPKYLGISPNELKLDHADWAAVDERQAYQAVAPFILHSIEDKLHQINAQLTPHLCTHALLNNALETTKKSRTFMEQNPTKKLPDNYGIYPGQLTHASCLSFVVGMFSVHHQSTVNLWDYHGASTPVVSMGDPYGIPRSTPSEFPLSISTPISVNYPISFIVMETKDGVEIVCRTLLNCALQCTADFTHAYLKVLRPRSITEQIQRIPKRVLTSKRLVQNELLHPIERTAYLPMQIDPTSQTMEFNSVTGLHTIKFQRKKNLAEL